MYRFKNREDAGELLVEKLLKYTDLNPVVLALPRGGLPIAQIISSRLKAPLDVVLVKKIPAPGSEEFAIGAVAEDENPILNEEYIAKENLDRKKIEATIISKISEIRKSAKVYRALRPALSLTDRTVIVVDDGLATGATMIAALKWLHSINVKQVIVAVPVTSLEGAEEVKKLADDFVTLMTPKPFWSVGLWYEEFNQVSDKEALEYLGHKHIDTKKYEEKQVIIADGNTKLFGALVTPLNARGLVLFAHGGGSSHSSPRNQFVAKALNDAGIATLLFDLLTLEEAEDRKNIFDIELMTNRLIMATRWAKKICSGLPIGYFGANTGAAAALGAAAKFIDTFAVVSRGGRPDLAIDSLSQVMAPVLLLVGTEDKSVVPLNESAQNEIKNCKTVLIPGAGHLFEEKGALEEVVEYATSWFSHHLDKKVEVKEKPQENIVEEIEDRSFVFKSVNDLDDWIDQLALHRIVMLGESTHGTKEYYEMRREISKRLIEDHGFSFVAVEGDWPDCFKLNEHIHSKNPETAKNILQNEFHRWPSWMWANEEIHPLIEWMKANKAGGFYGLDVYSLFDSIVSVKRHLKHLDPAISRKIAEGYSCLENFEGNETRYAKSLLTLPKGCQEEVVTNLRHLLRIRLDETILTKSQLFDIKQNARVINNAEKYYRAMLGGGEESWNVRDMHMMETLENLLNLHGPNSKAIVWAHNTHIGDYHATDMLDNGYINIGGLARERFGIENVYLVGFGSHHGEVTAGSAWGRPEQKMKLPNAQVGSYEDYFHKACLHMKADRLLTPLTDLPKGSPLYRRLGHRAVGVVYDPNHERSNYVPTKLANRYDAFMFIDETHALTSIHTIPSIGEFPETWPLGQ